MVNRSLAFIQTYGPITKRRFTFDGGYTELIFAGYGDFLTKETLWDFKVSKVIYKQSRFAAADLLSYRFTVNLSCKF